MRPLVAFLLIVWSAAHAAAGPEDVFTLPGDRVTSAIVTRDPAFDENEAPEPAMLRTLAGIVDVLDRREAVRLGNLVAPGTRVGTERTITPIAYIRLIGRQSARMIEVGFVEDGWAAARVIGGEPEDAARLIDSGFQELRSQWTTFPWPLDQTLQLRSGELRRLDPPYTEGRVILTEQVASERLFGGDRLQLNELARNLENEEIYAREPLDTPGRNPKGLLIWINAAPTSDVPEAVVAAADELGLIIATASNMGNTRPLLDRFQLVFDTLETVASRTHVDPARVYLAGLSGGGRSATMLCGTFPEVFAGAIGVVGLNSAHVVSTFDGRRLPAHYREPNGDRRRLLRTRPIAGITGTTDFNEPEMTARVSAMKRSGLNARLFREDGLGHGMCSAETFAAALQWVGSQGTTADITTAGSLLERFEKRRGERTTLTRADRSVLDRVVSMAPWTEVAWRAAGYLGYERDPRTLDPELSDTPEP